MVRRKMTYVVFTFAIKFLLNLRETFPVSRWRAFRAGAGISPFPLSPL